MIRGSFLYDCNSTITSSQWHTTANSCYLSHILLLCFNNKWMTRTLSHSIIIEGYLTQIMSHTLGLGVHRASIKIKSIEQNHYFITPYFVHNNLKTPQQKTNQWQENRKLYQNGKTMLKRLFSFVFFKWIYYLGQVIDTYWYKLEGWTTAFHQYDIPTKPRRNFQHTWM